MFSSRATVFTHTPYTIRLEATDDIYQFIQRRNIHKGAIHPRHSYSFNTTTSTPRPHFKSNITMLFSIESSSLLPLYSFMTQTVYAFSLILELAPSLCLRSLNSRLSTKPTNYLTDIAKKERIVGAKCLRNQTKDLSCGSGS